MGAKKALTAVTRGPSALYGPRAAHGCRVRRDRWPVWFAAIPSIGAWPRVGQPRGVPAGFTVVAEFALTLLTALLVSLVLSAPVKGEELVLDDGQVWDFAESLFKDGEYYRAISEYRRLIHFFPESPRAAEARLRLGEALLHGGEAAQAIAYFDAIEGKAEVEERLDSLHFLRGLAYLERERGRPYPLREETIAAGLRELRAIGPEWPGSGAVEGFLAALEDPPELPEKSPLLAGTLSAVIPGSGSFYVGRYAEGSLALFVNAVLIYATANALAEDKEGLGLVLGALSLAFYGGAIVAAANGAHKFNDQARTGYLARQRSIFGIVIDRGGLAGAFRRSF